jgi:acetyl-CoA C-acetyltransferase
MASRTVILGYARTPFGRLLGGLSSLPGTQLGGHAIAAAINKAGITTADVDHVIMGQVLQGGAGQIPSRQASIAAGLPVGVTSETINKVCASAHRAVTMADLLIQAGHHDVIVAGGMESMSRAPHLLPALRTGVKMGDTALIDAMTHDGLTDPFNHKHMVVNGAEVAQELGVGRQRQDEWAARSHQRAAAAAEFFAGEIAPVTIATRKGDVVVDSDESVRPDTTVEKLAALKPVMKPDGDTTAGNAPGVNDGATAIVCASEAWASTRGISPMAVVRGHAYVATDSPYLAVTPGQAIQRLLERESLTINDIHRIEINEAFASVALHSMDLIGADPERVNVNGGAIAMGHPIGASGARIIGTLVRELQRSGGGLGIAAICSGGGQGDAVLVEVG